MSQETTFIISVDLLQEAYANFNQGIGSVMRFIESGETLKEFANKEQKEGRWETYSSIQKAVTPEDQRSHWIRICKSLNRTTGY